MIKRDIKKGEKIIAELLEWIGVPLTASTKETPKRVSKMYLEIFEGLHTKPPRIKTFQEGDPYSYVCISNNYFFSSCFPKNTSVTTDKGYKNITKIKAGNILLTFNKQLDVVKTKVISISKRKVKELYKFYLVNGKTVSATQEHPFYVDGKWISVKELTVGNKLLVLDNCYINKNKKKVVFNKGYWLGYYLGAVCSDGSITRNAVRLEVNSVIFAKKFQKAIYETFGRRPKVEAISKPSGFLKKNINQFRVRVVSGKIVKITDEIFGLRKKTFTFDIPKIVFEDIEIFKGYIDGYVDGDGNRYCGVGKNGYIQNYIAINSANEKLIDSFCEIFKIKKQWHKWGFYYVRITPNRIEKRFYEKVKNMTITPYRPLDYKLMAISKIEIKKYAKGISVYNLSCEKENTFLANSIYVHNCEHHLLPFFGKCGVVYVVNDSGTIIGLSKIPRIINYFSSKPQLQERLNKEIAEYIMKTLKPIGVYVVMSAVHSCVSIRGVKARGSITNTAVMLGDIDKDEAIRLLEINKFFGE